MKNVLVLGAGISGLGAAHVLLRHECNVIVSDLKDNIKDIIENYNAYTLYKFIYEILNSLDVKYHILKDLTLTQYMHNNIFKKDINTQSTLIHNTPPRKLSTKLLLIAQ
mgnify:CR=1 FL=1